jgi:hypothetical protein
MRGRMADLGECARRNWVDEVGDSDRLEVNER